MYLLSVDAYYAKPLSIVLWTWNIINVQLHMLHFHYQYAIIIGAQILKKEMLLINKL